MMINSVLLGFSFSFEFVIQGKTSVTQDSESVKDSKASEPDRDIILLCVIGIEMMFYIKLNDDATQGSSI